VHSAEDYLTKEFYAAYEVFCLSENMDCLPFAGGWAEQPEWITQAISTLKVERFKVDEEEREIKQQEQKGVKKHG
jgi:acetate kinase